MPSGTGTLQYVEIGWGVAAFGSGSDASGFDVEAGLRVGVD